MRQSPVVVFLFFWFFLAGCSRELMISNPKRPVISPSQLEVRGGEVEFNIEAQVPGGTLSAGTTYTLTPKFQYDNEEIVFEPIVFEGARKMQSINQDYTFHFLREMVDGELGVYGSFRNEKTGEQESYRIPLSTTKGIITTSLLLEESYRPAYSAVNPYYFDVDTLILDFQFPLGDDNLLDNRTNSGYLTILDSLIGSDNVFLGVEVIGTHSPVGSNEVNRRIAESRAKRINEIYQEKIGRRTVARFDNLDPVTEVDFNSWDIFLEKLKESNYWEGAGSQVSRIIQGASGDYERVKLELQEVTEIRSIARDVYPKLQISRLKVRVARMLNNDQQFEKKINDIVQGNAERSMSLEDKLYVANQVDPRLRIQVYDSLAKRHEESWELYNNWAATYLDSYDRWDQSRGKAHVKKVYDLLTRPVEEESSFETLMNLGIVSSISGRSQLAMRYFDQASQLGQSLTDEYYTSLGVAALKAGKYGKSKSAFEEIGQHDKTSTFNYGLALVLDNRQKQAVDVLKSALEEGSDSSKTQYVQAIAANRTNNQNQAVQYLSEVFRRNPRYNDYYHDDHEFENINKVLLPRYPDSLKSPVRGFKRPRTFSTPVLAYPLPKPTFQLDITDDLRQLTTISDDIAVHLQKTFVDLGWQQDDISFFQLPKENGFALLAGIEQIDASGLSQFPPDRWEATMRFGWANSPNDFLKNYLNSLAISPTGSYRLITLSVEKSETSQEEMLILSDKTEIPSLDHIGGVRVVLSVYEFKKNYSGEVQLLESTGIDHYSSSGLARYFRAGIK